MALRGGGGFGPSARGRGGGGGRGGFNFAGPSGPPPPPIPTPSFAPSPASLPIPSPTPPSPAVVPHVDPTLAERPAKRTRFDFGESVTVLVGAEEKQYSVHTKLVCELSDFFRAAYTGEWKEGRESKVKFPEVQPATFDVYMCWIYTGGIDILSKPGEPQVEATKYVKSLTHETVRGMMTLLIESSALGDMLQDASFTNAVTDEYIAMSIGTGKLPNSAAVGYMWNAIRHDSGFARAAVDMVSVFTDVAGFDRLADAVPAGFMVEIARASIRDRSLTPQQRGPNRRKRCFYHDHVGEKGKTKCCSG